MKSTVTEDRAEIEQLMALYAHHGDRGFGAAGADPAALAGLFTQDGVWESGTLARFEGREAIAAGIDAAPVKFVVHLMLNPIIAIEGDMASGDWRALLLLSVGEAVPRWAIAHYAVRYRRTAQGWRIAALTTNTIASAEAGALAITG